MINEILPSLKAKELAKELKASIEKSGFIDFSAQNPSISSETLYKTSGRMFGILVCENDNGEEIILRSFSGQIEGSYIIKGYVPPCLSKNDFKKIVDKYDDIIHQLTKRIDNGEENLVEERKELSNKSFQEILSLYKFHTIFKNTFSFDDINITPPTGTGDCAAPKLLNYAFKNGLHPLSLAEIFIGKSKDKIDGNFYAPCTEKCSLILKHMLSLDIIYADEDLIVINKPSGLLSVPGRGEDKFDSAMTRVRQLFPNSPVNPSVHRLDMDTSGVLIFALNENAQRNLSMQFENRKVKKIYEALLTGLIKEKEGSVKLYQRLDVDNRPYQIIDNVNGKEAITEYKRLGVEILEGEKTSRVEFYPLTGRTHQLRVAAKYGICAPIISDRLYGKEISGQRLALHAKSITFYHPVTGEEITVSAATPF